MRKIGIQIFGENELRDHINEGKAVHSHCISIRNSSLHGDGKVPFPLPNEIKSGFKSILNLEFHDVEKREWLPEAFKNARIPEMEDIEAVIQFVRNAAKDPHLTGFTVHCWRGVSRSSAIAIGIAYMLCKDERIASEYITRIRPEAAPLPRIVKFWDKRFGSNLKKEAERIRDLRFKKMREDFYKEIDDETLLEELEVIE